MAFLPLNQEKAPLSGAFLLVPGGHPPGLPGRDLKKIIPGRDNPSKQNPLIFLFYFVLMGQQPEPEISTHAQPHQPDRQ